MIREWLVPHHSRYTHSVRSKQNEKNMKIVDIQKDKRVGCYSIYATTTIKKYLDFVNVAYKGKGAIEGQRGPLKTKTAQRIRERMINDIIQGAVLPATVLGILVTNKYFKSIDDDLDAKCQKIIEKIDPENHVTIIDGMQRTTALLTAIEREPSIADSNLRVEFWVSDTTNSLVYRMLVLNSGQIPWNLKRQLEIIFKNLKSDLVNSVPNLKLNDSDDKSRRSVPGEYSTSNFIELYILFGLRKSKVSLQDKISEEFARLDLIESAGKSYYQGVFKEFASLMVRFDIAISNTKITSQNSTRFKTGIDIFTSQPARIGFTVAISRYIFGLPGIEKEESLILEKSNKIFKNLEKHISFLEAKNEEEIYQILDVETLDERIKIPSGKVGEFEREYFTNSFKNLIELLNESSVLNSYYPLWVV